MEFIKRIYYFLINNKIPTLAGSLSFFVVLNGGSLLFLYVILSNYLPNSFINIFLNQIEAGAFKDIFIYFFTYQNNLSYSLILIITSLYSASSLYYHLLHIGEILMDKKLSFIPKRFIAIIFTIIFILLINFITVISTFLMGTFITYYKIILFITLVIIFSVIIIGCNMLILKTYNFKKIYKGFIFTGAYFIIFTLIFILYLRLFSNFKIVYGVLSFFIILMFYIYSLSIGLIIGIYLNCKKLGVFNLLKEKE